jgi:hypothetical protein
LLFLAVMEKEEKNTIDTGVPDHAFKVKEIGSWAVFFSKEDMSVYFRSSACLSTVLRLSRDDLLTLAQEMETWRPAKKDTEAAILPEEKVRPAGNSRDKRHFRRFTRRCEAEFTARDVTNRGIASDFSINGLFIRTNHPLPADSVIDIVVHLPDGSVSYLRGKVKRANKPSFGRVIGTPIKAYKNGMGIELTMKDSNYLHFIRSLIK